MADQQNGLDYLDYIILSILLLISASIGVYYRFSGGRQQTTKVCFHNYYSLRDISVLPLTRIVLGVPAGWQKYVIHPSSILFDGKFHVINHPTWSLIRKLLSRHPVCSDQPGLHYRNTSSSLLLSTSILQPSKCQCVQGDIEHVPSVFQKVY